MKTLLTRYTSLMIYSLYKFFVKLKSQVYNLNNGIK